VQGPPGGGTVNGEREDGATFSVSGFSSRTGGRPAAVWPGPRSGAGGAAPLRRLFLKPQGQAVRRRRPLHRAGPEEAAGGRWGRL